MFRLRGYGVPVLGSTSRKGDLNVQVTVAVPKKLNDRQKDLLKQFAAACGEDWVGESNDKKKESLFSKLKDKL